MVTGAACRSGWIQWGTGVPGIIIIYYSWNGGRAEAVCAGELLLLLFHYSWNGGRAEAVGEH